MITIEKLNSKFENIKVIDTDLKNISKIKLKFNCKIHGIFEKRAYDFLKSKHGCPECAMPFSKKGKISNTNDFLEKINKKFPNYNYDYSKVNYKNSKEKIIIICKEHGEFLISPNDFLRGKKCSKCSRLKNNYEFIKEAKNKFPNYDYNITKYIGYNNYIMFKCNIHGIQKRIAKNFLKNGCTMCTLEKNKKIKINENKEKYFSLFKEKFKGKFEYLEYVNAKSKMKILCKEHNVIFYQTPYTHLKHNGCPLCCNLTAEKNFYNLLINNKIKFDIHKTFNGCKDKNLLSYDFYIKDKNLLIELNGEQHYFPVCFGGISKEISNKNFIIQQRHDEIKKEFAKKNGIKLLIIPYTDYDKLNKYIKELN